MKEKLKYVVAEFLDHVTRDPADRNRLDWQKWWKGQISVSEDLLDRLKAAYESEPDVSAEPEEITLRDKFACAALANVAPIKTGIDAGWSARTAYAIADAMLEARK